MLQGYDIGLNGLGVIALCRRRVAFQDVYKRQTVCTHAVEQIEDTGGIAVDEGCRHADAYRMEQDGQSYAAPAQFAREYGVTAVSYTHLDVYKRQVRYSLGRLHLWLDLFHLLGYGLRLRFRSCGRLASDRRRLGLHYLR